MLRVAATTRNAHITERAIARVRAISRVVHKVHNDAWAGDGRVVETPVVVVEHS